MDLVNSFPFTGASPRRVVSLLPSMTDSFLTLGLGGNLVGVTDYCPQPKNSPPIQAVGGPKDARTADILVLHPDLVIVNREENSKQTATELAEAGIPMWITFPKTVRDALGDLRELAHLYASDDILQRVVWLERAVDWLRESGHGPGKSYFCPIWKDVAFDSAVRWITFGGDTYANDLLSLCGGKNVVAADGNSRYPRVGAREIEEAQPEYILLPSEPFAFTEEDARWFNENIPGLPAVRNGRILRVDGRDVFWHGTRLGESIRNLPGLFFPDGPSASV